MIIGENEPPSSWIGWAVGGIGVLGSGALAAIRLLYFKIDSMHAATITELRERVDHLEERSAECEADRNDLRVRIAELEAKNDACH